MSISLSEYAGWLYQRPGVQPLLLELQDSAGADVLLLLVACWLGRCKVQADPHLWQTLHQRQQPWRQQVIEPLRQVRRALSGDTQTAALYAQVKACELAAEWYQLERLEQDCLPLMRPDVVSTSGSIQAQLSLCGQAVGDQRLQVLAELAVVSQSASSSE